MCMHIFIYHIYMYTYKKLPITAICGYTELDVMTVMFITGINFSELNAASCSNQIHASAHGGFNNWI